MLAIFNNVNNWYWFEVREIIKTEKWYKIISKNISQYKEILHELPTFKCKKDFKNKKEYYQQFWNI